MIDEPTTDERLAALLARRSGRADRGPVGRRPQGRPAPMRGGPTGGVFDFDTPGWPAPGDGHRSGPTRRLLADNTMPLAAVPAAPTAADATVGERLRDGAERWVRSWSPSRLVASGASAVSFVAMVLAMGPLLQPGQETATDTDAGTGAGETDPALTPAVEPPAVSISVDPLAATPGTPLDATGQPVPLSGTAPDGALPGTVSSGATPGTPGASPGAIAAPVGSTTQPIPGSPVTSAAQGTAPATAAPTTPPPATAAPTTAMPGSTAAPTTQPPATAAPATQAPTTAAPTTQPPTTAAPTTARPTTTAPPTSKGS